MMETAFVGIPAPLIVGLIWEVNLDYIWWIGFFYLFLAIHLMRGMPGLEKMALIEG